MADAHGSGPCDSNIMWVQVPSSARYKMKVAQITSGPLFILEPVDEFLESMDSRSRLPARSARKLVVHWTTLAPSSALILRCFAIYRRIKSFQLRENRINFREKY